MVGSMKYVIPEVLREIENIKLNTGIRHDSEAQRILVKNSLVGKELERLDFLHPKRKK